MWGLRGEMERNHPSEPFKGGRPMSAATQHQTSGLSSSPATLIQEVWSPVTRTLSPSLPWVSLVEAMVQSCSLGFSPF